MLKRLSDTYQKLSKREKWALYVTVFILSLVLTDRVLIGPLTRKIAQVDLQIADELTAVKKSIHVLKQEARVRTESQQLAPYVVVAKNPEQEMTELLREMENLASQSSVSLVYVKPASGDENAVQKKYYSAIECEAQMEQLVNLFYSIESSPKLLMIEKFELQPKNKESTIVRCVMTVSKAVL